MRPQGGGKEATTTRYRKVKRPGHALAHADGAVYAHRLALFEKIGSGSHRCHWCQRAVYWGARSITRRLVADHLDGDTWNNAPSNLVASCNDCNLTRTTLGAKTCKRGHPRTEENTYRRPDGTARQRSCLACITMRNKKHGRLRTKKNRRGRTWK